MIEFTVYGKPQPAGSKKAFVVAGRARIVDDNAKSRPWKQQVTVTAAHHWSRQPEWTPMDPIAFPAGPLVLEARFYLARPKGHYGTGRNAGVLKASAPAFPAVKPDTTKLLRGLEDALTGVLWRDDAQIVSQHAFKRYGEPERVVVVVASAAAGVHHLAGGKLAPCPCGEPIGGPPCTFERPCPYGDGHDADRWAA